MAYQLEGRVLEVCTCKVICPCWAAADPDGDRCDGVLAYHIDTGTVNGEDVSGLTIALLAHIPGNALKGNWRVIVYVDDSATPAQQEALVNVWTGKLGGPLADLAQLVGEVAAVERAAITFEVEAGKGHLRIGPVIEADVVSLQGATGQPMTMQDTVFSTIPGSPAYVAKAPRYLVNAPQYGFNIDLQNHSAIQGSFRFAS